MMTTIRALLLGTLVGCASTPSPAHAYDVPPNCHFGGTYEIKLTLDHCESGSCEPGFREFIDLSDPNHPLDEHMQPTGEHCDETDAKGNPLEPHIYVTGNNGDDHCVLEWNRVCHLDGVFDSTIYIYGDQDIGDELWDVSFALSAKLVASEDQFSGIYDGTATRPVDAPRWSIAPKQPQLYSTQSVCIAGDNWQQAWMNAGGTDHSCYGGTSGGYTLERATPDNVVCSATASPRQDFYYKQRQFTNADGKLINQSCGRVTGWPGGSQTSWQSCVCADNAYYGCTNVSSCPW